jgi:small subunit ribosomal protein S6
VAVNTYECLFLLDPNKASADWEAVMASANGIIEKHGGEIVDSRPWGEPKLAYPIKKFKKGNYLLTYFNSESTKIPEMEKDCRLNEAILRHMILKLHPQIAEDILAHLRGEYQEEYEHEEERETADQA